MNGPQKRTDVFFDGPQVFDVLAGQVLPDLIRGASTGSPIRIWVPTCRTGEEAYSLAICLLEQFRAANREPHLRIFATDSDTIALEVARQGLYPESIASSVSSERLHAFFHHTASRHYRVKDELRHAVVIGTHDLLTDPPMFSKIDLISYRNISHGLARGVIGRLVSRFHFALKESGWLLLGGDEAIVPPEELFESVSVEPPLYRKRAGSAALPAEPAQAAEIVRRKAYLEDELQAANRTIALMAGELEVANEELRESNAQLRSLNEELGVLNDELQHKVRALNATNDDLTTLLTAIDVAVVFLDADLRIRRFTATAAHLLKLTLDDLGRPLRGIASELADRAVADEVRRVIDTAAPSEAEILADTRRWYLRRVLPYPATEHRLGAVVTWVDITQTKSLQEEVSSIAALEQQRIGQELHDGTQQELTGLGLLAQTLSGSLSRRSAGADRELAERLARGIAEANGHVRALARGLVPVPIDADSLAPALAELARATRDTFSIACDFEAPSQASLSDATAATHLYRIAQEAVRNATSHSRASHISIRFGSRNGELVLAVEDNGIGLPPRRQKHQGVGMRLMRHRCSIIGGRFIAEPQPGGGTIVACVLPAPASPGPLSANSTAVLGGPEKLPA